jgi:hypothetical protein
LRWQLILEEFGLRLIYILGEKNIVANALSKLHIETPVIANDLALPQHAEILGH